jgi:hypothetical protein
MSTRRRLAALEAVFRRSDDWTTRFDPGRLTSDERREYRDFDAKCDVVGFDGLTDAEVARWAELAEKMEVAR